MPQERQALSGRVYQLNYMGSLEVQHEDSIYEVKNKIDYEIATSTAKCLVCFQKHSDIHPC